MRQVERGVVCGHVAFKNEDITFQFMYQFKPFC